ncbi:TPA: hypothetical protein OUF01_000057 [Klebsiella michiganensis]|nr:hypothetical protein [Klebsiella michiganensis]HCU0674165.1 hypothetical protein [Klebsiella michiganensis]
MTSELTREENVQAVFDLKAGYTLGLADVEILKRVARMALAEMDSEPVAWMHNNNNIGIPAITVSPKIGNYWMSEFKDVQPLYRHAQQPVVPDGLIAAVNRLLDSDGSRGCYSAIQCGDAHDEIERLLAAAQKEVNHG